MKYGAMGCVYDWHMIVCVNPLVRKRLLWIYIERRLHAIYKYKGTASRLELRCCASECGVTEENVLSTERLKTDTGKCIAGQASTFSVCCFSGFTLIKNYVILLCISVTTVIVNSRATYKRQLREKLFREREGRHFPFFHIF